MMLEDNEERKKKDTTGVYESIKAIVSEKVVKKKWESSIGKTKKKEKEYRKQKSTRESRKAWIKQQCMPK